MAVRCCIFLVSARALIAVAAEGGSAGGGNWQWIEVSIGFKD